jgi:hypothetical protein
MTAHEQREVARKLMAQRKQQRKKDKRKAKPQTGVEKK